MPRKKKQASKITTEELARRLFPKPLFKKLKELANPKKRRSRSR